MKKRLFVIIYIVSVIMSACSESSKNQTITDVPDTNTVIEYLSDSVDSADSVLIKQDSLNTRVHIFKKGETLWDLCRGYYGNRHYSSLVAIYNKIDDVNRIKPETEIRMPDLLFLLMDQEPGLHPLILEQISNLITARDLFMHHEESLYNIRENVEGRQKLILPDSTVADLHRAVELIDSTIIALGEINDENLLKPSRMISQLRAVKRNLNNLEQGNHDGLYGYDLDMVHQNLINALKNAVAWSDTHRNDFK